MDGNCYAPVPDESCFHLPWTEVHGSRIISGSYEQLAIHQWTRLSDAGRVYHLQPGLLGLFWVLPEFAWMGEKTTGLARAGCSTKQRIRHLLHAERLAQREFRIFGPQLTLAWQSQGRELMLIDVHSSKFRKNLILPGF